MATLARLRKWLMAVLAVALAGTLLELLLLAHYEEPWQFVPLALIVAALGAIGWHTVRPGAGVVRGIQLVMTLFVVAGVVGVVLHLRGAAEFQREIDPSMATRELLSKALRAQSPPALAPGVMSQMGLIGLIAVYRDPALEGRDA
jgi:hypothetical protein